MDWDSPVTKEETIEPTSIENKWKGESITFERQYFRTPILPTDIFGLHPFSDAGELAFGAVAYLRRLYPTYHEATIIASKSRVSPVKKSYSIPQKELMGIEKAAQLTKFTITETDLKFNKCYIWTDSLCSVDQLVTNNANSAFSRNRLKKIKSFLPDAIISHIPGKQNPADIVSRGCSLEELRSNELWWKGPSFLHSIDPLPLCESSIKNAICNLSIETPAPVEPLLNPEHFNSLNKLLNVIMIILLFPSKLLKKSCSTRLLQEQAKMIIMHIAQAASPPSNDTIRSLHFQLRNDVWFFNGRQPTHTVPFLPDGTIARHLQDVQIEGPL